MTTLPNKVKTLLSIILLLFFAASMVIPQPVSAQTTTPNQTASPPITTSPNTKTVSLPINTNISTSPAPQVVSQSNSPVSLSITVSDSKNGKITGNITASNTSNTPVANTYAHVSFSSITSKEIRELNGLQVPIYPGGQTISYMQTKPTYTLKAKGNVVIPFTLNYSPHLYSGTYYISVIIGTVNNPMIAANDISVNLSGLNTYLSIIPRSCFVMLDDKEYAPNIAPGFDPNVQPTAKCSVYNPLNTPVTISTNIDYSERFVANYPSAEKFHLSNTGTYTLEPKQTKEVTLTLPALSTPQVYEAYISFVDKENNIQSTYIPFRWTVKGESGYISEIRMDKDEYKTGDTAYISFSASSSMDLFWRTTSIPGGSLQAGTDLAKPTYTITLTNSKGQVCATKENTLSKLENNSLVWNVQQIPLKIATGCPNPKVAIKLLNSGKVLDAKDLTILTTVKPTEKISTISPLVLGLIIFTIIGIVLIVIIASSIFLKKKKANNHTLLLLLALVGTILFSVLATQVFATNHTYLPRDTKPGSSAGQDAGGVTVYDPNFKPDFQPTDHQLWYKGSGANHGEPFYGNFWTPGSKIVTIDSSTVEVTFWGYTANASCANWGGGFLLTNLIDSDSNNLVIDPMSIVMLTNGDWITKDYANGYAGGNLGLGPNDINIVNSSGPIAVKYRIRKTSGNLGSANQINININLILSKDASLTGESYYSSEQSNEAVYTNVTDRSYYCGNFNSGPGNNRCMGRVDIPIPGGVFDQANNTTCRVSGWARKPSTTWPSSGPQQTDIEIWKNVNTAPVLLYRGVADGFRSDLSPPGNYGFNVDLSSWLRGLGNQDIFIYGVEGNDPNKLWSLLAGSPKTINCKSTTSIGGRTINTSSNPIGNVDIEIYSSSLNRSTVKRSDVNGWYRSDDFVPIGSGYAVRMNSVPSGFSSQPLVPGAPDYAYENQIDNGSPNCGLNCHFTLGPVPPIGTPIPTPTPVAGGPGPSCQVSWNITPSTPYYEGDTINVRATKTLGPDWVSIYQDGIFKSSSTCGNDVCIYNLPVGFAGNHTLQFAADDDIPYGRPYGSRIFCSPSYSYSVNLPATTITSLNSTCNINRISTNNLTWNSVPRAIYYKVKQYNGNGVFISESGPVYSTSYQDTSVVIGNSYRYGVVAYDVNNTAGKESNLSSAITAASCPAACTILASNVPPTVDPGVHTSPSDPPPYNLALTKGISNAGFDYISYYRNGNSTPDFFTECDSTPGVCTVSNFDFGPPGTTQQIRVRINDNSAFSPSDKAFCGPTITYRTWPQLTASCTANPINANVGDLVNYTTSVSGGNGTNTFSWTGAAIGSGPSLITSYSSSGAKDVSVRVTSGTQVFDAACPTVNVSTSPPAIPLVSSASLPGCTPASGNTGNNVSISWTNNNVPVTDIRITDDNKFTDPAQINNAYYYHLSVSGSAGALRSHTAPFDNTTTTRFTAGPGASGNLILMPGRTYYVRTWNGEWSLYRSFTMPAVCSYSVSGTVFLDTTPDRTWNTLTEPVTDVNQTVELVNSSGTVAASTIAMAGAGTYTLTTTTSGTYTVRVSPSPGYFTTNSPSLGFVIQSSSGPSPAENLGVLPTKITAHVFVDDGSGFGGIAGNGAQDGSEANYSTATVSVTPNPASPLTTYSSGGGYYTYSRVPFGTYTISLSLPPGYYMSPGTPLPPPKTVSNTTPIVPVNFGIIPNGINVRMFVDDGSGGGRVGNGIQDGLEILYNISSSLGTVDIKTYNSSTRTCGSTVLPGSPPYSFSTLNPGEMTLNYVAFGSYCVTLTAPTSYSFTLPGTYTNTATIPDVTLDTSTPTRSLLFGIRAAASIGPISGEPGSLFIDGDTSVSIPAATNTTTGLAYTPQYGFSGLKSNVIPKGSDFYNPLILTQKVRNATDNNYAFVATAFTKKGATISDFASLQDAASDEDGIILVYVNTCSSGTIGTLSCIPKNSYARFADGTWINLSTQPVKTFTYPLGCSTTTCKYEVTEKTQPRLVPFVQYKAPTFGITFYKGLGDHNWDTHTFLQDTTSRQDILQIDPEDRL